MLLTKSHKIANFANNHHDHPQPPQPIAQIRMTFACHGTSFSRRGEKTLFLYDEAGMAQAKVRRVRRGGSHERDALTSSQ
jgi:hypothetical protein